MKLIIVLATLASFSASALDKINIFENENGCKVAVSEFGPNTITVIASKQVKGKTKQVGFEFDKNLKSAEISSYCSEYNEENTTISIQGEELVISCLNERGKITTDLDQNLNLSSLNFEGYHYYFLFKKDDSFNCKNLVLLVSGFINGAGEFVGE